AWNLLTQGSAPQHATTAVAGLAAAYARDENDEFVLPTTIGAASDHSGVIRDGDCVLFMNFRSDRARQLTRAFTDPAFDSFTRATVPQLAGFVTTTEYAADIDAPCAFPPQHLNNVLGDYLSQQGKTQLRLAETEKYAHVTFFFSGGREEVFPGEERIMVPSPDVATYDLQPAMSAAKVTDKLVDAIRAGRHDLIVCNYANGDMVGHTGILAAAIQAVEVLDGCLGRVEQALLETGGQALVTADHGNCEQMLDYASGQRHTQHTTEHVPLVYIGQRYCTLDRAGGILADIAPSLLSMMGLQQPAEMTGHSLVDCQE
ncbi:MAG: 2,3-bisphosphoglycerate-independent phosphoglycerate mutase, partial [Haliea sp.]|nr:2,3-bisphosphoglycerate-independent phosphoglycerate mutase [Haliea sp.]